jgi:hypothetical protein
MRWGLSSLRNSMQRGRPQEEVQRWHRRIAEAILDKDSPIAVGRALRHME